MPVRVTEFAPALPPQSQQATRHPASSTPASGYGPPTAATRLGKQAASLDLTSLSSLMGPSAVRLERHFTLMSGEERADGSLRVVYTASLRSCRPCPLRKPRQWNGSDTSKPRQVSVLLHPLVVGSEPLLWRDWGRSMHRRACMRLLSHQCVEVSLSPPAVVSPGNAEALLSRAQRAHSRLSWETRFARNARSLAAGQVTIRLFGVPERFALFLGFAPA